VWSARHSYKMAQGINLLISALTGIPLPAEEDSAASAA
jgi:hypothetical protein